jgi:hypothetical protein
VVFSDRKEKPMVKNELSKSKEALHLKKKIEEWKENRISTNTKMPEVLWFQAGKYANVYGTSSVSKFLKIGYVALKKRALIEARSPSKKAQPFKGFVELPAMPAFHTSSMMEVLLANPEGVSATIRNPDSATDWEKVFSGWFKASRSGQEGRAR